MGQAKARHKAFGAGAHNVATYVETEVVTAYRPDPEGEVREAAATVHAASRSIPTAFHPDRDDGLLDRMQADVPPPGRADVIVVVDPDTFAVVREIPEAEFDERYQWIPGTVSYARKGGREIRVAISGDGRFVLEGGVTIDDPVAFCRGKLRKAGKLPVLADAPLSFQLMSMFLFPGLDTDDAHLPHVLALAEAMAPFLHALPPHASADVSAVHHVGEVVEESGGNGDGVMPDLVAMSSAIATLVDLIAADCPDDAFTREYCRVTGMPLTAFRPRSTDDPALWEDLEGTLAAASVARGREEAIGDNAVRTTLDVAHLLANGGKDMLADVVSLLSNGLARWTYEARSGGSVELLDFPGRAVMVLSMPGEAMELVAWDA
jgi:hypothetical protein